MCSVQPLRRVGGSFINRGVTWTASFNQPARRRAAVVRIALLVLLLAAAGLFVWRGPVRAIDGAADFELIYGAGRAYLTGDNPYHAPAVRAALQAAGTPHANRFEPAQLASLYPPSTLGLVSPIAALSWPAARGVWTALNVLAAGLLWVGLVSWLGWFWRDGRTVALAIVLLAWAPLHTGIALGQTTLLAVATLPAGLMLIDRGRPVGGGVIMALGMAFKPQVTGLLLGYLAYRHHWRAVISCCLAGGLILAAAAAALHSAHPGWLGDFIATLGRFRESPFGDATGTGPYRFQMIHLGVLLHGLTQSRAAVTAGALSFTAGVLAVAGYLARARRPRDVAGPAPPGPRFTRHDLPLVALVAAAHLLPGYHRFYDALVLLPAAAWTIHRLHTALALHTMAANSTVRSPVKLRLTPAVITALALSCFLVPGAAALHLLAQRGMLSEALVQSPLWRWGVLLHQPWAVVVIVLALLAAIAGPVKAATHRRRV